MIVEAEQSQISTQRVSTYHQMTTFKCQCRSTHRYLKSSIFRHLTLRALWSSHGCNWTIRWTLSWIRPIQRLNRLWLLYSPHDTSWSFRQDYRRTENRLSSVNLTFGRVIQKSEDVFHFQGPWNWYARKTEFATLPPSTLERVSTAAPEEWIEAKDCKDNHRLIRANERRCFKNPRCSMPTLQRIAMLERYKEHQVRGCVSEKTHGEDKCLMLPRWTDQFSSMITASTLRARTGLPASKQSYMHWQSAEELQNSIWPERTLTDVLYALWS